MELGPHNNGKWRICVAAQNARQMPSTARAFQRARRVSEGTGSRALPPPAPQRHGRAYPTASRHAMNTAPAKSALEELCCVSGFQEGGAPKVTGIVFT